VPIVAPILLADPGANVTAVWLGVMIGLNIQTSFLTPPFGFALFYLRGIAPKAVKTINMYKGVIPFIALQILAMVIVANSPNLVNYLPNRVSLLSENSPPPRNPQLAFCVDQYVSNQISENGDAIIGGVEAARAIDLSILPKKLAQSTAGSFDNVELAISQLRSAEQVTVELTTASEAFRPLHKSVRATQRSMRQLDAEIKHDQDELQFAEDNAKLTARLNANIAQAEAEKEELAKTIPSDWEDKLAAFRDLQKTEKTAYQKYARSAQAAYQPIAETNRVIEGNAGFADVRGDLLAMKAQVESQEPEEMVDVLAALGKRISAVAGAKDISGPVSKARRALKSRNPDKEKAQGELDKAIAAYEAQVEWRAKAEASILPKLSAYENTMRKSIGIRDQAKLTKTQALFVARCQSNHRDVSLNF